MPGSDRKWFVALVATEAVIADLRLLMPNLLVCEVEQSWLSSPGDDPTAITDASWNGLIDVEEVRKLAKNLVEEANHALNADSPLHPRVEVGGVIWQQVPNDLRGYRRHYSIVQMTGVSVSVSLAVAPMTLRHGGYVTCLPRTTGLRQRELAAKNPDFHSAVALYEAGGDDIGRLWLVYEYVKKRSGIKPERLVPGEEIKAFETTANNAKHIRHIGGKNSVSRHMGGSEARDLMRRLLIGWVEAKNPH